MRAVWAMVALSLTLGACDRPSETFGKSYSECLLRNGRTQANTEMIETACKNHFEVDDSLDLGASAVLDPYPNPPLSVSINIQNPSDQKLITLAQVEMLFYDEPESQRPADEKPTPVWWTFPVSIPPQDQVDVRGSFSPDTAPSRYFSVTAKGTRTLAVR